MASSLPESIPGYYYNQELNRYFKIPPNGATNIRGVMDSSSKAPDKVIEKCSYRQHTVTQFRNKTTQLYVSNHDLQESAISCIVSRGVVKIHAGCSGTVHDIKFNDEGTLMALYTVGPVDQEISIYTFAKQGRDSVTIMGDQEGLGFITFKAERYYKLGEFYKLPGTEDYRILVPKQHNELDVNGFHDWDFFDYDRVSSHVVSKSGDYYVGLENGHVVQAVLGDYGYMGLKLSKSSINDMAFLNKDVICCGCDSGCVYLYDVRYSSVVGILKDQSSRGRSRNRIVKLHPLNDGYQLITSAMNSKLRLWDIRTGSVVHSFPYHTNSHSFTSSLVDTQENFLAATGDENDVRFWSLTSGELITKLSLGEGPRPVVGHTHHLGGIGGPPTLVIGQDDKLSLYSINNLLINWK